MVGDKKIDFVMTSCLNTYPEGAWLSQDGGTDPGPPGISGSFRPLVRTTPGGKAPGPRAWGGGPLQTHSSMHVGAVDGLGSSAPLSASVLFKPGQRAAAY